MKSSFDDVCVVSAPVLARCRITTAKRFSKKFLEIGLTDANYDAFNAEGLNTLGTVRSHATVLQGPLMRGRLSLWSQTCWEMHLPRKKWHALGGCLAMLTPLLPRYSFGGLKF